MYSKFQALVRDIYNKMMEGKTMIQNEIMQPGNNCNIQNV